MKRGKNQSLYKYLPETWIDFSVRGKERKQYIAKVERWNGVKLENVNTQRLIRTVNDAVQSFASQSAGSNPAVPPVLGFGAELTKFNCDVLTPRVSEEERTIVARISPLTFYCKHCYKVYQFNSEEAYHNNHKCFNCHTELTQFRQIYFCKCGYATDKHNVRCPEHGFQYIKWDGKYNFVCTKPGCNKKIPMQATCPVCNSRLGPKVALDPAQFFVFSLSLIDLIDERLENFIADTEEFKKIVTGETIDAEQKGQPKFDFEPYCKLLFSANNIPRIGKGRDSSAILRRLVIVPFNAKFDSKDPNFKPFIGDSLKGQESMEYLIQLGIQGLKRVLNERAYTTSQKVQDELDEYEEINNPILGFFRICDDEGFNIEGEPTNKVYQRYQEYCIANTLTPMSNGEFSKQVKKHFGFVIVDKKINGKKYRIFVKG